MPSPRFLRPHEVTLLHINGEADGIAQYLTTELRYVKIDEKANLDQSSIGKVSEATGLLVIDMNDLNAVTDGEASSYVPNSAYSGDLSTFSIWLNDLIIFNGKTFTVANINEINPFRDEPEFIEVEFYE